MTNHDLDPAMLGRAGLTCEVDGALATLTLNRPRRRNAQTPGTWHALAAVGRSLDAAVRVVVVRGAGASFSSGLDRAMLTPDGVDGEGSLIDLLELTDQDLAEVIAGYQDGFSWLRRGDIVSIAAVQGAAVGAGFQLALACDLRVCADDVRFSMREPGLGLVPDLTGTKPLVDLVGYSRALEICATTRWVDADEARDLGLATVVVPRAELDDTVADLARAVTASAAGAVTETKLLLQGAGTRDLDAQRRAEREAQVRRFREMAALLGG